MQNKAEKVSRTAGEKRLSVGSFAGGLIGRQKRLTVVLLALVAGAALAGLVPPLILGRLVDGLAAGTEKTALAQSLIACGLAYFGAVFLARGLEAAREIVLTIWGEKLGCGVRSELSEKLSRLPASYFVTHSTGDTVSRFADDVDTLEDLFSSGVISMAADAASLVGIVIVIFTRSAGLGMLLLIALPLIAFFTVKIQKRALAAQKKNRLAVAAANRILPETVKCRRPIRLYHGEGYMEERYDKAVADSFEAKEEANFCDAVYSPVVIITQTAVTAVMMILAVQPFFTPLFGISAGTAAAFIAYIAQVFNPIESIGMEIQSIQSAAAGTQRIAEFLEETERTSKARNAYSTDMSPIAIENLSFAYEDGKPIFSGFDLTVREGESVVLTGRTGEGKSTLFKLILGLYPPAAGSVKIYGTDAAALSDADRRKLYGCVEQDFHPLAGGTILQQITLDDPAVSEADAFAALKTVGLFETVNALPRGLRTAYTQSVFSAGQTQLLSIARAIAANPKILLLDEITSDLDAQTEKALMEALSRAAEGRTVLSISHRTELLQYGREVAIRKADA